MPWNVKYDSILGIIRSMYAGRVSAHEFKEGTIKAISLAKKYKTLSLLIDNSKLESAVSTMEIYDMPQYYAVYGSRKSRMAIVLPPSGKILEDVKFYVTVCQNNGWTMKAFAEHEQAVDWLLPDLTSNQPVNRQQIESNRSPTS